MRHSEQKYRKPCNCRSVDECSCNDWTWKQAIDRAVDDFAERMKQKLYRKASEGRSGWDNPAWTFSEKMNALDRHFTKASDMGIMATGDDFVDIANFAMFLWNATDQD